VTSSERRRHLRQRIHRRALFDTKQRAVFTRLHDISEGGLSVRAPMPFAPGEELVVTLGDVRVRVQVRWTNERPRVGMGFRILEVLDGGEEFLTLTRGPLLY
jgi:hypothetical protein